MMRRSIKKVIFSLILVLSVMIVNSNVSLAAASVGQEHVHEFSSTPRVERVISEEIVNHFYYTSNSGITYDYQTVIQNCLWYYECYCGHRGNYYTEGRKIYRDVEVK